ncbi:MAG: FHA domain-containing protein [Anaerolineales bacterium]|nr:FHA domain-containing protein [Anaerolineales bacterium]MCB9126874.1 FHA domain-containing protein [Ardenticatenales bacterium]
MTVRYPKLTIIHGTNQQQEYLLDGKPVLIGRGQDCDVPLQDFYASRHHCWIEQEDDGSWLLRDLGSKNGTLLNGVRVKGTAGLNDGATISIGSSRLRFGDPFDPDTKTYNLLPAISPAALTVDLEGRIVRLNGSPLDPPLSPKQWLLLALLYQNRGEAVAKDEIAQIVWPEAKGAIFDYQIDKLVSRLRMRLGSADDEMIETVWGYGYRLH